MWSDVGAPFFIFDDVFHHFRARQAAYTWPVLYAAVNTCLAYLDHGLVLARPICRRKYVPGVPGSWPCPGPQAVAIFEYFVM
jgi:hypothetical protein